MIKMDEDTNRMINQERFKKLGFKPQKEIYCNKLLPYADKIDDESQKSLQNIKENLYKAVAMRELKPGIGIYISKLLVYIKLYGLKFSKEDHINFIQLILSLMEIPHLEPAFLNKFFVVLIELLRKSHWLSPDDLQIDWKPLYELSKIIINKNCVKGDLYRMFPRNVNNNNNTQDAIAQLIYMLRDYDDVEWPANYFLENEISLETNIQVAIQRCARYFSKESTQEILDEIYPQLYPLDTGKVCLTMELLSLFLNPLQGHEIWLETFMELWNKYQNPSWNLDMMNIMGLTADKNIGYINWEPYLPVMFTRILRSLDLPVCYKNVKSSRPQCLWAPSVSMWVASVLGPKSSAQQHLTKLMGAIETYLHPANSGKWLNLISEIIVQIPKYFFERLILERYKKPSWRRPVPDDFKLTEECITSFVKCFKPIALQAMYSRISATEVGKIFKYLAELRPELIIPDVVERVYTTVDSVTEPQKMVSAIQCLFNVSLAMVSGFNGYTNGKTHVIPILFSVLPGIDPNDLKKTSVTLQFLTSFALLVPIVDCSKASLYYNDLTEEEMIICGQTAEFESFVLQFLDKVFVLIDSSATDIVRMEQSDLENNRSKLETVIDALLQSSAHGVLGQCSKEILESATKKFTDYVKTHMFEPRVAAHLVACVARVFSRVAGELLCKSLLPYLFDTINQHIIEHDDVATLEKQNDEFFYYLIILTSVMRCDPHILPKYIDEIVLLLDKLIKFKCKLTVKYANAMIINILTNFSTYQAIDVHTIPECQTKPLSEFLPIRHWGAKSNDETKIDWYVPNENGRKICEKILHRYLPALLYELEQFINDEIQLSRDETYRNCTIILALLKCGNFLPNWVSTNVTTNDATTANEATAADDEIIDLFDSIIKNPNENVHLTLGFDDLIISMPSSTNDVNKIKYSHNVRLAIIDVISRLQEKILSTSEDDIKSLKAILMIWERVHARKQYITNYELQSKGYKSSKAFQEYKLTKKPREIRAVLATRILMQLDCRDEFTPPTFTKTHKLILENLLRLSISHYSSVRLLAQNRLFNMLTIYPYSYRCLLPDIVKYMSVDSNECHEMFKGILYVICGQRRVRLITKHDWDCIEKIWLSLLKTNLSEKPSVIRLLDTIVDNMTNEFQTLTIRLEMPERCIEMANKLVPLEQQLKLYNKPILSANDIELGKKNLIKVNDTNLNKYLNILNSIINITHNNSLHWRYGLMASNMIFILVHPDIKYPSIICKYVVDNLINESIGERRIALRTINCILRQQKRIHKKIPIDPWAIGNTKKPSFSELKPGVRTDNEWLQYDAKRFPKNQAEWDEPRYLFKVQGFFGWQNTLAVYAPSNEQPPLDRTPAEMTDIEIIFYDFFTNPMCIKKIIEFWSLEDKKGKDKFKRSRCTLIKYLCDTFGDLFIYSIIDGHLIRLIEENSLESNHRCAAEILCGIIKGAKHWPFEKTQKLYEKLQPIIRLTLKHLTVETDKFWGTCFATASESFDPIRQYWLHEVLLEDPLRETTSFTSCGRMFCLQGTFNQHVWRMNSVSHRLLEYFRPYLNHPFQMVRERLAYIVLNIFEVDIIFQNGNPHAKEFIDEIVNELQILYTEMPTIELKETSTTNGSSSNSSIDNNGDGSTNNNLIDMDDKILASANTEYDNAVRLFKTVSQWVIGILNRNTNGNTLIYFELLPFACRLERCEQDVELADICSAYLGLISQALTLPDLMATALQKINDISLIQSWSARLSVLDVLQVLVFNNMLIILSKDEWVQLVQDIVLRLLEDAVLEVREKAAQVLGGLIHCSFLPATNKLLELFKKKCRTKVTKRRTFNTSTTSCTSEITSSKSSTDNVVDRQEADSVRMRHMGVLGLCAFISAYPYDIPDFVPDVFEHLGAHLNDPQPIPSTIRKTVGDFKRTHHDNWAVHQLKFTESQLAVLSDLTIPPSYYA